MEFLSYTKALDQIETEAKAGRTGVPTLDAIKTAIADDRDEEVRAILYACAMRFVEIGRIARNAIDTGWQD